MNGNIEELITALYDMIQDAKALPLGADKCIIERDRALDMLDELSAQLPGELKQAKTIVQSRDELVAQARREAENMIRAARAQAEELVKQENIYQEARRQCELMVIDTQNRINQLRKVGNEYMDESLRQTEEVIAESLNNVRLTREKFQAVTEGKGQKKAAPAPAPKAAPKAAPDVDLDD